MNVKTDIIKCELLCPVCGLIPTIMERSPCGMNWCVNGHAFRDERIISREMKGDGRLHTVKVEYYIQHYPERDAERCHECGARKESKYISCSVCGADGY